MSGIRRAAGRIIIVSGQHDLTAAIATAFTAEGSRIALLGPEAGELQVVADALDGSAAPVVLSGPTNEPSAVTDLVSRARDALGGLDAMVRLSTPRVSGPPLDVSPVEWRAAVDEVLGGAFTWSQATARLMEPDGGVIVNVATVDAVHAYPARSAWSASMSGLVGLTRALGLELAAVGVRANLVIQGPLDIQDHAVGRTADDVERTLLRSSMGRLAQPHEVAAVVLFVSGERAAFMTGQTLRVDGGWAALNQAPTGMRFP